MVRIVSLSVLLTLIVILGLTFFRVLAPFILPLFLAAVFAILCQPIQEYFLSRTGNRYRLASGLTTGAVVAIILVPLVVGTILASLQLFVIATNLSSRNLSRDLWERTEPVLQYAADFLNARMESRPVLEPAKDDADDGDVDEETTQDTGTDDPPSTDADPAGEQEPAREDEDVASESEQGIAGEIDGPAGPDPSPDETPEPAMDEPPAISDETSSGTRDPDTPETADESPTNTASPRGPPQPVTAESLRAQLQTWLREWLSEIGRKSLGMAGGTFDLLSGSLVAVGSAALSFVIFAIALYYFLADGTQLVRAGEHLIPVHVEYQRQLLDQFAKAVRAVVMATFFAALAQSIATVAALWIFGFNHLFVIFVVALLMSMIPMLGTWLVWMPCAAYLAYLGHWGQALLLTTYGAVFVGTVDNLVRTYVLNSDVQLHPLLALISVLGGLQVLGLWGMFVGPIVASCLHALVKIFNHELTALSKERFAGPEEADQTGSSGTGE